MTIPHPLSLPFTTIMGDSDPNADRLATLEAELKKMTEQFQALESQAAEREKALQAEVSTLQHALELVQVDVASSMPTIPEPKQEATSADLNLKHDAGTPSLPEQTPAPTQPDTRPPGLAPATYLTSRPSPSKDKASGPVTPPALTKKKKLYQLTKGELGDWGEVVKDALRIHVCVLSGWGETPDAVPRDVDRSVIEGFYRRIPDLDSFPDWHNGPPLIPDSSVELRPYAPVSDRCRTRSQISRVEQNIVVFIRAMLARFGLPRWGPDFNESPYGGFNSSNRIIALDTFVQAATAGAYEFMRLGRSFRIDMAKLISLYDHIVHFHFYSQYLSEKRRAGSVSEKKKLSAIYNARTRLSKKRIEWVEANGFAGRYEGYLSAKATSDDEKDKDGKKEDFRPVYWIKKRPERSAEAEAMIRALDAQMDLEAGHRSRLRKRTDKIRRVPTEPQQSYFPALPTDMPIDYYRPAFYNSLPPRLRASVAVDSVGLLPLDQSDLYFTECTDELLSWENFQEKYAQATLKKYKRPNLHLADSEEDNDGDYDDDDEDDAEGQTDMGEDGEALEDEDQEMSQLDEEEMMEYISSRRSQLAAELSERMDEDV